MKNPAEKYLSSGELVSRANDVFKPFVPDNAKMHVRAIPFKKDDLVNFSIADIENEMAALALKPKDLVKLLNIDKSTISIILSEGRSMSKSNKAMFYWLFKSLKETKTN